LELPNACCLDVILFGIGNYLQYRWYSSWKLSWVMLRDGRPTRTPVISHAATRDLTFFSAAIARSFPSTHFLPFLSISAASHLHGTSYHHARGGGGRAATVMASGEELPCAGCSGCRSPIADGRVRGASMVAGRLRVRVLGAEVGTVTRRCRRAALP
jgi:hypothetical protein